MVTNKGEPSSKLVNVVKNGLHVHNSHTHKGASSGHQDVNADFAGQLHRHRHSRIRTTTVDESESLSDIEDVQVTGYFLNKEEMHYKRIIWEAMNREYPKRGRQQKRATEAKIQTPAKRAAKTTSVTENEKCLSSKINYDALKKLNDELNLSQEKSKRESTDYDSGDNGDLQSNKKLAAEVFEPGKSDFSDEFDQGTDYREDGDSFGGYDGNPCYGYEEEEDGYGHDENCDYED
ncbi:uncharacterized protein LOC132268247 [Cornus florida]|uniref:uncharacterized protein LOC132268247 n=1 Tax=Cornus florida TaxID=4283 RepID=UPI00289CE969|nr:uncharacterized protein LOC132268247 [Cornus florida]